MTWTSPPHRSPPPPPPQPAPPPPPQSPPPPSRAQSPSTPFMTPMTSPHLSPLQLNAAQLPPFSPSPATDERPDSPMVVMVPNGFIKDDHDTMIIGKVSVESRRRGLDGGHRRRTMKSAAVTATETAPEGRVELAVRITATAVCVAAFSVMLGNRTQGWDGDSFRRYVEFRYLVTVNVMAFIYSAFQVLVKIFYLTTRKFIISRPFRCFDLLMDQILAYLLMSASSAAASRNDVWVSRFGSDDFTNKANKSIIVSFFAFFVFSLSSIISAYTAFSLWLN